jgi:hypothetical protein
MTWAKMEAGSVSEKRGGILWNTRYVCRLGVDIEMIKEDASSVGNLRGPAFLVLEVHNPDRRMQH